MIVAVYFILQISQFVFSVLMSSTFSFKFVTSILKSPFYQGLRGDYTLYPKRLSKLKRRTLVATEKKDIQLHSESFGIAIRGLGLKCVQAHSANSLSILFGG